MTMTGLNDLQPLLEQFTGEGMVLSCYAPLFVDEGFRPAWEGPLQAKSDELWKAVGEDGRVRRELQENIDAIRQALKAPGASDGRWLAVFSAARRGFLKTLPLDVPTDFDLILGRSPYLVPLLAAIYRRREYLVVQSDSHRGRIHAATPRAVRLLREVEADVPKHQHSTGERFGYDQAAIDRHRDDRILHYRKDLVREIEKSWDAGRFDSIVLFGDCEVIEHIRDDLPQRLAERVRYTSAASWHDSPGRADARIQAVVSQLFTRDEAEVVPGFWDLLEEGQAVTGRRAVIDAVQSGRLAAGGHGYLVLGTDPREAVGRCTACRALTAAPMGPCPKCQAPCVPGNLWEELLLTALQHRIEAHFVPGPGKLAAHGGIAAVLPKPVPKSVPIARTG